MPIKVPKRDLFLGADPGASGGVVVIDRYYEVQLCAPWPKLERDVEWLRTLCPRLAYAALEKVHAGVFSYRKTDDDDAPKMGVTSAFSFGANYGEWRGLLRMSGADWTEMTPKTWQAEVDLPKFPPKSDATTRKRLTKQWALHMLTPYNRTLMLTHATSAAALIAVAALLRHELTLAKST
jgi:hypothetical protein